MLGRLASCEGRGLFSPEDMVSIGVTNESRLQMELLCWPFQISGFKCGGFTCVCGKGWWNVVIRLLVDKVDTCQILIVAEVLKFWGSVVVEGNIGNKHKGGVIIVDLLF